jgi:subtilisin family serine protease
VDQAQLTAVGRHHLGSYEMIWQLPAARVDVMRCKALRRVKSIRDDARLALGEEAEIEFAGRVLVNERDEPVIYTENVFVQFAAEKSPTYCRRALRDMDLTVKRALGYARNTWFVGGRQGIGTNLFGLVEEILQRDDVLLCHPELIKRTGQKATAFPQQWHLRRARFNGVDINEHAQVQAAWDLSEGEGVTIAVIDDGVDIDHEEFSSAGKVVAPRDVTLGSPNPRPGPGDRHGTACAGVACANGKHGAFGVAPKAKLMPIRLASGLGSQAEADAIVWAADHGADVISCSWGPFDGDWTDPDDPLHDIFEPLPDSTRLAIDHAVTQGRIGKGCAITWAAGNGNEPVSNDGYASYPSVIAVAACNDEGTKCLYSDHGAAVWCSFPSRDFRTTTQTPGIWTTDNTGFFGYNRGNTEDGDAEGHYTNSFGGTSSSCPGAAGVCALVIARNPELRWDQVKNILRQSSDPIDSAGGKYDATGHSDWYGYGRLNAKAAVELAVAGPLARYTVVHQANHLVAIRDHRTSRLHVDVCDSKLVRDVRVDVDIEHTWIGDLTVRLRSPAAMGVPPIVLHERSGDDTQNIRKSFTVADVADLGNFIGTPPNGRWQLEVTDHQRADQGRIVSFSVELTL